MRLLPALVAAIACMLAAVTATAQPRRTVLHEFAGGGDGNGSAVGLTAAAPGVVYGVSGAGGTAAGCCGSIFRLTKPATPGADWPLETLYRFTPGVAGNRPVGAPPVTGFDGALYGTATFGGPLGGGVVWRLRPPVGGGSWSYEVLHAFDLADPAHGVRPAFGLVMDAAGALYGLAAGGANGNGVVFALLPPAPGATAWAEQILYDIPTATVAGGATVLSAGMTLSLDQGDLFGGYGVNAPSDAGHGYVFRLHRGATGWSRDTIQTFSPYGDFSPLLTDATGRVFGTFFKYGAAYNQFGTIFALSPPSRGQPSWSEQDLFTYDYNAVVYGPLVLGAKGELFGTIGLLFGEPPDAIFRLQPPAVAGSGWTYSLVYTFQPTALTSPSVPTSLARDFGGNLLGVTVRGGTHQKGVVFRQEISRHSAP